MYTNPDLEKPQIIEIPSGGRKKLDLASYIKRTALNSDFSTLIKNNLIIMYEGRPLVVYLVLKTIPGYSKIIDILKRIQYVRGKRTTGLKSEAKIFGYSPRETIRKDYCSSTSLASADPQGHYQICSFGKVLSDYYKKYCPEMFEYHTETSKQKIMDDWKIEGTPFTSGIINKNNPLKYHFDKGNISQVYSNMIVFKNKCKGGYLSIPEFDIGLECSNKSIVFFDGQDILHGVTPFTLDKAIQKDSYRFSIVYYTLKAMWKCETIDEELARIKQRKTDREITRYKRATGQVNPEEDENYRTMEAKAKAYRDKTGKSGGTLKLKREGGNK
jgi:hypothetical protein